MLTVWSNYNHAKCIQISTNQTAGDMLIKKNWEGECGQKHTTIGIV
jgi:hypothetical protein